MARGTLCNHSALQQVPLQQVPCTCVHLYSRSVGHGCGHGLLTHDAHADELA